MRIYEDFCGFVKIFEEELFLREEDCVAKLIIVYFGILSYILVYYRIFWYIIVYFGILSYILVY
jgi:hypothetical protein